MKKFVFIFSCLFTLFLCVLGYTKVFDLLCNLDSILVPTLSHDNLLVAVGTRITMIFVWALIFVTIFLPINFFKIIYRRLNSKKNARTESSKVSNISSGRK